MVENSVIADRGEDYNFISVTMVRDIRQKILFVGTIVQIPVHVYRGNTGEQCLTCSKALIFGEYLQIRHSSSLILRNIEWKIIKDSIGTPKR